MPDGDKSDLADDIDGVTDMGGREQLKVKDIRQSDYISRQATQ